MKPLFLNTVTALACAAVLPASVMAAGHVESFDPSFARLVAADAKIEKLTEGYTWSEGPLWYQGGVIFSDVPENVAYRWTEGMAKAEVFVKPSGLLKPTPGIREPGSNGWTVDREGRLLVCQHGERRVARYENGEFVVLADRYDGKRFNSPNDLVVHSDGSIYFTDPPYALEGIENSPLRELPFAGVYRLSLDGTVTLLSKSLAFPNGIAFSPDEKTLYIGVSEWNAARIVAYDVQPDGTLANERVFFDAQPLASEKTPGSCDGLKVDREGNLWSSGPGGVLVINPAGKLIGRINTGVPTANCAWGDDGSVLYITANKALVRVKTLTKGAGW